MSISAMLESEDNFFSMPRIPVLQSTIPKLNGRSVQLPPKQVDPRYLTLEHRLWSKQIKERAGYACERCGATGERVVADHIKELRDGGNWELNNGQCLCESCHASKTIAEKTKRAFSVYR